jgi:hypothetical protein
MRWLGLFTVYALAALWVLGPAMRGDFVSDDLPNLLYNPYVQELSLSNLAAILDPRGAPAAETFNYAPVHMLVHALEWRLFGEDVRGYHVAQALAHAAAAGLLAALLAARGLPFAASAGAGAFFLLHPANVEASAWIFQIKTTLALALALGALLLLPSRPGVALGAFALALLTKASAAFALPMAAVFAFLDRDPRGPWRMRTRWLVVWALVLVPYAFAELRVLGRMDAAHEPLHPEATVAARTVVAIAGRYLAMAATGFGVAPSHEPPPALSALDPWWVAGLAGLVALAARTLFALRRRREESAWWVGAAAAYLPIAQIGTAFIDPMADRYLYFALPGLIGGCAFAARDTSRRHAHALPDPRIAARAAGAVALALLALFAWRSHAQAAAWRSATTLAMASAARYPEGLAAQLLAAQRGALRGDAAATVAALRAAAARGYDRVEVLAQAPVYDAVRPDPAFQQLIREMAASWVKNSRALAHPTEADLRARANACRLLDDDACVRESLAEAARVAE